VVLGTEPGDVMVSVRAPVGDTNIADQRLAIGRGLAVVRGKEGVVTEYLRLVIQASTADLLARSGSGMFSSITGSNLRAVDVPCPSEREQLRIVDLIGALDAQGDALEAERLALRSTLASLREALIETVTWEPILTLAAPGGIQIGPFGSQLHAHDYVDGGVPVVMPQDIIDGEIRIDKIKCVSKEKAAGLKRHRLCPGDLVLPRRGDLTKRALVLAHQDGWLCGTGSIRIRIAEPDLAPALLEGLSTPKTDEWLTANAVGTTMLNLNTEIVSKIPAPVFSTQSRGLADCCVAARGALKAIESEAVVLRAVRSRLLADLLNGEVEIPEAYDSLLAEAV
jgi:type I restriction enzyme S subunit